MLVLSRRSSESIVIGDDVTITILTLSPSVVRLGITAPKNVAVHRNEIYERIRHDSNKLINPDLVEYDLTKVVFEKVTCENIIGMLKAETANPFASSVQALRLTNDQFLKLKTENKMYNVDGKPAPIVISEPDKPPMFLNLPLHVI